MKDLTLYFVRHGESVANLSDRNGDERPDDADRLSELGWEQARGLGRRLEGEGEGLELIVASPMTRASLTASSAGPPSYARLAEIEAPPRGSSAEVTSPESRPARSSSASAPIG